MEYVNKTTNGNDTLLQQLLCKVDELLASRSYDKEFLTIHEASTYLGVADYTLSRWISLGMLPASKPFKNKNEITEKRGRARTYIKKSDLLDVLEGSRTRVSKLELEREAENKFIDQLFGK